MGALKRINPFLGVLALLLLSVSLSGSIAYARKVSFSPKKPLTAPATKPLPAGKPLLKPKPAASGSAPVKPPRKAPEPKPAKDGPGIDTASSRGPIQSKGKDTRYHDPYAGMCHQDRELSVKKKETLVKEVYGPIFPKLLETTKDHETSEYSFNLGRTLDDLKTTPESKETILKNISQQDDAEQKKLTLALFAQLMDKGNLRYDIYRDNPVLEYLSSVDDLTQRAETAASLAPLLSRNIGRYVYYNRNLSRLYGEAEPTILTVVTSDDPQRAALEVTSLIEALVNAGIPKYLMPNVIAKYKSPQFPKYGLNGILAGHDKGSVPQVISFVKEAANAGLPESVTALYLVMPDYNNYDSRMLKNVESVMPQISSFVTDPGKYGLPGNFVREYVLSFRRGRDSQNFESFGSENAFEGVSLKLELIDEYQKFFPGEYPFPASGLKIPSFTGYAPEKLPDFLNLAKTISDAGISDRVPLWLPDLSRPQMESFTETVNTYWLTEAGKKKLEKASQQITIDLAGGKFNKHLAVLTDKTGAGSGFFVALKNNLALIATAAHIPHEEQKIQVKFYDTVGVPGHNNLKRLEEASVIVRPRILLDKMNMITRELLGQSFDVLRDNPNKSPDITILALSVPQDKLQKIAPLRLGVYDPLKKENFFGSRISSYHVTQNTAPILPYGNRILRLTAARDGSSGSALLNTNGAAIALLTHGSNLRSIESPFSELIYRDILASLNNKESKFDLIGDATKPLIKDARALLHLTLQDTLKKEGIKP